MRISFAQRPLAFCVGVKCGSPAWNLFPSLRQNSSPSSLRRRGHGGRRLGFVGLTSPVLGLSEQSCQLAFLHPQARCESQRIQLESELAVQLEQRVTERLAQAQESSLRQAASLREHHRCLALTCCPRGLSGPSLQSCPSPAPPSPTSRIPSPLPVFSGNASSVNQYPISHTSSPQSLPLGTPSCDTRSVPPSLARLAGALAGTGARSGSFPCDDFGPQTQPSVLTRVLPGSSCRT